MASARLLVTAFEPFGGESINPSVRVLEALRAAGDPFESLILPVVRERAAARLVEALDGSALDAWLGLGQAGGRGEVTLEAIARNRFVGPGEPAPRSRAPSRIAPVPTPDAYVCRWPVGALARALRSEQLPARVSYTAGLYVCNEVLFTAEQHLRARGPAAPWAGFAHLPYLPEQLPGKPEGTPALALDVQTRVIRQLMARLTAARAQVTQTQDQEAREQPQATQARPDEARAREPGRR